MDRSDILPTDYIELNATAIGPRLFEPVHVRIYGSGLVERETVMTIPGGYTLGCPLHDLDKVSHVSPFAAKAVLERARDGEFRKMWASYQYPGVMDGSIEEVRLDLHGELKSVWNHNGNPPAIFGELAQQIWTLSGIEAVADFRKFSPERKAECARVEQGRLHR